MDSKVEIPTVKKRKKLESLVEKARKKNPKSVPIETAVPSSDIGCATDPEDSKKPSFTVLGKHASTRIANVTAYLPEWLRHPVIISSDLNASDYPVEILKNLDSLLMYNLVKEGITHLFPVQSEVIPWLLNDIIKYRLYSSNLPRPRDMCISAPTGSGKTLTYVLPIIQCLSRRVVPKIRALIISPVQELVVQITSVFKSLSAGTKLKVEACIGGKTPLHVEQEKLVKKFEYSDDYESLVDILVITPGRLVEHLQNTEGFDLRSLRYLVMDEADRLFENVQNDWLYHLEKHISSEALQNEKPIFSKTSVFKKGFPQRLLFSATLSQDPEKLKKLSLFQPILFSTVVSLEASQNGDATDDYIGSFTTPQGLKEKYTVIKTLMKPLVVSELVKRGWKGILCFTKSALDAHKLSKLLSLLNPTLNISEISSLLPTEQRERILKEFSCGTIDMLISSDVMARGIDIKQVKFVISYDPPKHIKGYIHRVGRTGRAGSRGTALTILTPTQAPIFEQMLHSVNKDDVEALSLEEDSLSSWMPIYQTALQKLKLLLQTEEPLGTKISSSKKTKSKKKSIKKKRKKVGPLKSSLG